MTASTAACRWTVNAPCLASVIQTAPCAATFGKRFCPTIPKWNRPCRGCPQSAASAAANRFRSMGVESTALIPARKHPGKSRPQPECANSGAKRLCNALVLNSACSATNFCAAFSKGIAVIPWPVFHFVLVTGAKIITGGLSIPYTFHTKGIATMKTYQTIKITELRPGRRKVRFNGRKRKPQRLCDPDPPGG